MPVAAGAAKGGPFRLPANKETAEGGRPRRTPGAR